MTPEDIKSIYEDVLYFKQPIYEIINQMIEWRFTIIANFLKDYKTKDY